VKRALALITITALANCGTEDEAPDCNEAETERNGKCVCEEPSIEIDSECLSPGEFYELQCCECLANSEEYLTDDSCLSVSIPSCQAQGSIVSAQCYCWEQCYDECRNLGYPYNEPPNGCDH
jgi:hypothetical protein